MSQPKMVEFGPVRVIGVSYIGQNKNNEIPTLWEQQIIPRVGEIKPGDLKSAFGICRCVPDAPPSPDGYTFEYIGGLDAAAGAPVPAGMKSVDIPRGHYIVIEIPNLKEVKNAWMSLGQVVASFPEWQAFCGPQGCQCATHPSFEYYPPNFTAEKPLFLYVPVEKKNK